MLLSTNSFIMHFSPVTVMDLTAPQIWVPLTILGTNNKKIKSVVR